MNVDVGDLYWDMYYTIRYNTSYYLRYRTHARRWDWAISILCAIASAGSIASWSIWNALPSVWLAIVMVMQVVQIIRPYLPASRQAAALDYMLPELTELLRSIHTCLNNSLANGEFMVASINDFQGRYAKLEGKYVTPGHFPLRRRIVKKAEKDAKTFFEEYFNTYRSRREHGK